MAAVVNGKVTVRLVNESAVDDNYEESKFHNSSNLIQLTIEATYVFLFII